MTLDTLLSITVEAPDDSVRRQARGRWDAIAKPVDGLGKLEEIVCRVASILQDPLPDLSKKALIIMCADNGVTKEGVTQTDQSVTRKVAALMGQGKSSVGIMTKHYPVDIFPVDAGINSDETPKGVIDQKVAKGTADFLKMPAMSTQECLKGIQAGMDSVRMCAELGYRIIATGEMGIGNTTSSSALLCALTGIAPETVTGRGAGLSEGGMQRKLHVIQDALQLHFGERKRAGTSSGREAFEALRRVGGLDLAALTGVFIQGAVCRIPVVIDGLISAVAALCAEKIVKGCSAYMIASHRGRERGTWEALRRLGLEAVIDADLALGEGSGAVMLLPLLDMAMLLYREGTLFSEIEMEQYERFPT